MPFTHFHVATRVKMDFITDTGPTYTRVARLLNVHFDATDADVARYLQAYTVIDQVRSVNPSTKANSTIHVLFKTVEDKVTACNKLSHGRIMGRDVKLSPAPNGAYNRKSCPGHVIIHILILSYSPRGRHPLPDLRGDPGSQSWSRQEA
jgi:hypothetical protein